MVGVVVGVWVDEWYLIETLLLPSPSNKLCTAHSLLHTEWRSS